jgi:hypothetical protein
MLASGKVFPKEEGKSFPVLPENIYLTELLDIELQTKPDYNDKSKTQEVLSFQFTCLEGENRTRNLWANFVPTSLYISKKNGKNKLYRIVEAMLKRDLTSEEEANGITSDFLNSLIGKQCKVFVEVKQVGDKEFNNILRFMPADVKGAPLSQEEKSQCVIKKKEQALEVNSDDNKEILTSDIPF